MKTENSFGMWTRFEYPADVLAIAKKRIAGLFHPNIIKFNSVEKLVVSAYCQGLIDSAEALKEIRAEQPTTEAKEQNEKD